MIHDSPSHIYHSALPLLPSSSWLRKYYEAEAAGGVRVLMGLPDRWDTCSRTILLEGEPTAFAYWGDIMAVGLESNVVLLDAIKGSRTSVLCGHRDTIRSLAFSKDGTLLVSRSNDKTVKLWDAQTGGVIKTFGDDTSVVSTSISPDGTTIAMGTRDGRIRLWEVRTGKSHSITTRQDRAVTVINFSPIDSRRLLSLSWYKTVQQWDVGGHQIGTSYHEADRVDHIAYALDGTRFVSCGGRAVTVRDSDSGALVVKLDSPDQMDLHRCCFSSDGRFVACAAGTTIWVWDITTLGARLVGRLVGHSSPVAFIDFSSSLISGSVDRSVKFWQGSDFLLDPTKPSRMTALHGSTPIMSVNLFAEEGVIVTSDESGVVKTWDLTTGRSKSSFLTPAKGIRDTHLAGDTLIVVWWVDEEKQYHIWDVGSGRLLRRVHSSLDGVEDLKIAGDGSKIFGLCGGCIEARSIQTGGEVGNVSHRRGFGFGLIVRGSKVEYDDHKGWGWDFGSTEVSTFKELPDRPRLDVVDWSGGRRIKPRWIEDTVARRLVFRIPERYMGPEKKIGWDGRYLIVWSRYGEAVVMDFNSVCPV